MSNQTQKTTQSIKSQKQSFLDQNASTTDVWLTQQVLIRMSKTRIAQVRRVLAEINNIAYTTPSKQLPFEIVNGCFIAAEAILTADENGNNVENKS